MTHRPRPAFAAIGALAVLLTLGGCGVFQGGGGPKTPTIGKRISILSNDSSVQVDANIAGQSVILPQPLANANWPQSGGNANKVMGHVALAPARSQIWSAQIAGGNARQKLADAPVVADGRLFAVGIDAVLSAFDAGTGALLWRTPIGSSGRQFQTVLFGGGAAVDGNMVFATSGAGDVAALNAADGKIIWTVRPGGPLRGSPTVAFGGVYVVAQDNQIYALSAADGSIQWQAAASLEAGSVFGTGSPAAAQGTIVAGFSSGELQAYRYENGRDLWDDALARTSMALSVSTLTDVDADPVIDRGRVFALGQGGRMAAYELLTGQRTWEISIAGISTPWVAGEWVFVVTDDAKLLCVARGTGRVRWISQLQQYRVEKSKKDPIRWTGPVLAGGRLLLVNSLGTLAEVSPDDGSLLASQAVGGPIGRMPVVAGQTLYLMQDNGRITAWR